MSVDVEQTRPGAVLDPVGPGRSPVAGRRWRRALAVVVLTVAVGLAATPLLPVFGASTAVPGIALGLAAGAVLAALGAWGRWPAVSVAAVAAVVLLLAGAALVGAPAWAGVVPTPAALGQVALGLVRAWKDVATLTPPLGASGDVLLVPFALTFVGALTAVGVVLRAGRAACAAVAAPVLVAVVAALLGTATPPVPPALTGAVLAGLALVGAAAYTGSPNRRRWSAAALVVMAMLGGYALAPVAASGHDRFVLRDHLVPPFDPSDRPSPLAGFRSYVKDGDTVLFTVRGLPAGGRVTLAVLDRYDGDVWNVAAGGRAAGSGEFRRIGGAVPTTVQGTRAQVTVTVANLTGIWLPTVGGTTRFDTGATDAAALRYDDATGAAVLTTGLHPGLTYTLDAVVPASDASAHVGTAASADVPLPDDVGVPSTVQTLAQRVARDAGSPAQQAVALSTWLVDNGYFSHGLVDEYPSLPGHGAARLAALLGTSPMVGDGEQYAAALALMARAMNLPARVVLGFVPGSGDATTAAQAKTTGDVVEVRGKDVQAWVEIDLAGLGWVAFDATPPTSRTVTDQQNTSASDPQPQVVQPAAQPSAPARADQHDTRQPQTDGPAPAAGRPLWQKVALCGGGGLAGLLVLFSPALVVLARKARRRRRRRRGPDAEDVVTGGWAEVVDVARDLRRSPPASATRSEAATVLALGTDLAPPLHDLARRADHAVFGARRPDREEASGYWADVDAVTARLWHTVGWRARLRARVSARSLRRGRGAVVAQRVPAAPRNADGRREVEVR